MAQSRNNPNDNERKDTRGSTQRAGPSLAVRKGEAAMWISLRNMTLSERSWTQKDKRHVNLLTQYVQKQKAGASWVLGAGEGAGRGRSWVWGLWGVRAVFWTSVAAGAHRWESLHTAGSFTLNQLVSARFERTTPNCQSSMREAKQRLRQRGSPAPPTAGPQIRQNLGQ